MDLLRQIVASPRSRHPEANLDLCYVTPTIIATSGPGASYPQIAYRNPLKDLVRFLDAKHTDRWAIWEFRAEGTGYADADVYHRINHYPWPDHHPPPFRLVPLIMASMREWLREEMPAEEENGEGKKEGGGRVVVVHCKAGKGRSGTIACSYLVSEEGWTVQDAMKRFTERRMRSGFGPGVSIPSQVRYLGYVDRWTKAGKVYVEREVEIVEVHVWGLRDGVKVTVEGYVEDGKKIKAFHTFRKEEQEVMRGEIKKGSGLAEVALEVMGRKQRKAVDPEEIVEKEKDEAVVSTPQCGDVVFRPASRIVLPSCDVNLDFERRNNSKYGGFTVVTSVAHVWFNTFFEGKGPEQGGKPNSSGVFDIGFDAMDGIKGSSRKGTRAFDRMSVAWKFVEDSAGHDTPVVIEEPSVGAHVEQTGPADPKTSQPSAKNSERELGLRAEKADSASISRASSVHTQTKHSPASTTDDFEGTQNCGPDGKPLNGNTT